MHRANQDAMSSLMPLPLTEQDLTTLIDDLALYDEGQAAQAPMRRQTTDGLADQPDPALLYLRDYLDQHHDHILWTWRADRNVELPFDAVRELELGAIFADDSIRICATANVADGMHGAVFPFGMWPKSNQTDLSHPEWRVYARQEMTRKQAADIHTTFGALSEQAQQQAPDATVWFGVTQASEYALFVHLEAHQIDTAERIVTCIWKTLSLIYDAMFIEERTGSPIV